jgi:excisionase family DNA binding protein
MERLLLTPLEASAALGISRSKVYELMGAGALASIRIGNCRRVPVRDLEAFVRTLQAEQAANQDLPRSA